MEDELGKDALFGAAGKRQGRDVPPGVCVTAERRKESVRQYSLDPLPLISRLAVLAVYVS